MAKKINMNTFAKDVTLEEGLKKNTDIAQVKEVLRISFTHLRKNFTDEQILLMLESYR